LGQEIPLDSGGRNAKIEDESWRGQEVQGDGLREDCQAQGLFEPHTYKKNHQKEAESPKVNAGGRCQFEAGIQAHSLSLIRLSRMEMNGKS
jgi:hypothetical protein